MSQQDFQQINEQAYLQNWALSYLEHATVLTPEQKQQTLQRMQDNLAEKQRVMAELEAMPARNA